MGPKKNPKNKPTKKFVKTKETDTQNSKTYGIQQKQLRMKFTSINAYTVKEKDFKQLNFVSQGTRGRPH